MLPKIEYPLFDVVDPLTKAKIQLRPMLIKEEKILLIAKQSDNKQDQLLAVKQIINNCVVDQGFDIETFPFCSLEWLFLKLRAQSIGNVVTVQYQQGEENKEYKIDLDKVEVKKEKHSDAPIKLSKDVAMTMKLPTVKTYSEPSLTEKTEEELLDYMIISSIDKIYEGEKVIDVSTYSAKDLNEFVNSLPAECYKTIQSYFDNVPSLYYSLKIEDDEGKEQTLELTTLDDFFTFV